MKILLALPPDTHNLEIYRVLGANAPPLGLAYIAGVLEKAGYSVRIVDSPTLKLDQERFIDIVKEFKPDIIGFSLLTPLAPKGYEIAHKLKELFPETILVAGGQHPTFMYSEALSHGFDIVVRFEGEYTMLELVKTIERYGYSSTEALKSVKGIAFRDREGNIVVTDNREPIHNLDELPFPARHLLPMDKYTVFGKSVPVAHIMASRGCPYGCIFCSTSYFWGRRIRIRSVANVADEIEHVVNKYKAKYIVFTDDELTWSKKWVSDLIDELKKRGLDIQFTCGARVDHLQDFDFLKKLVDGGCIGLFVGVESASQNTLNLIGKKITVEQAEKFFENVKKLEQQYKESIDVVGSFVIGFPWETVDDMKKTIDFAVKLDPTYAQFTIATPYPGTPLYDYAVKHNLIIDWNWEHYTTLRAVMKGLYTDAKTLEKLLREAYRRFYVRAKYLLREARKGRLFMVLPTIIHSIISWLFG
ncbi:MAG: cobalamin-dependent protein [Ignisphaera sp.]|nr:cobalamin-dependent protein [Ignisphaera sp.]